MSINLPFNARYGLTVGDAQVVISDNSGNLTAANMSVLGNATVGNISASTVTSTKSMSFGSGGSPSAGSIYSDSSWGCLITSKQSSPTLSEFSVRNAAGVERIRVDTLGNTNIYGAITAGINGAVASLSSTGNITAHNGNNAGTVFLGNTGTRYISFDGNSYQMPNGNLYVNGSLVTTATNNVPSLLNGFQVFTTTGNFTVPPGVTTLRVTVMGAGAGGYNGNQTVAGSGGYCQVIIKTTQGTVFPCTVAPKSATSTNGGTTSFGTYVTCTGGQTNGTHGTSSISEVYVALARSICDGIRAFSGGPGASGGTGYNGPRCNSPGGGGGGGGFGGGGGASGGEAGWYGSGGGGGGGGSGTGLGGSAPEGGAGAAATLYLGGAGGAGGGANGYIGGRGGAGGISYGLGAIGGNGGYAQNTWPYGQYCHVGIGGEGGAGGIVIEW